MNNGFSALIKDSKEDKYIYNMSKFSSNDYPYQEVLRLRKKVLKAYSRNEDEIELIPNTTRKSPGYIRLQKLILDQTGETISFATFVSFFTKRPFKDTDGEERIRYEIHTIDTFKEFVEINHVTNEDIGIKDYSVQSLPFHIAQRNSFEVHEFSEIEKSVLEDIKSLLHESFQKNKTRVKIDMKKIADEEGNVTVLVDCVITAKSPVSVLRVQCFSDHPITIEDIYVYETVTKKPISSLLYQHNASSYTWYIVLPTPLGKDESLYYSYYFTAKNYFRPFFYVKGHEEDELVPTPNKYGNVTDEFYFPNTEKFADLNVHIESHPNKSLIGKYLEPIIEGDWKVFRVNHGDLGKANKPIRLSLKLSRD